MTRKRKEPEPPGMPEVDPATGIRLLKEQIEKAQKLLASQPLSIDAYTQWELVTRNYLEKAFGRNTPNVHSVMDVGESGFVPFNVDKGFWERERAKTLTTQVTRLEGLIELLNTELKLEGMDSVPLINSTAPGRRIFLVHGIDEAWLHQVARFLEKLELEIIILREQPNQGRTIIEKFVDYSDVSFAVVLLTPDDRGGPASSTFEEQHLRARQNVIFELGYFLGKLGRDHVCALYCEDIEIPSDYSGVLYIALGLDDSWQLSLAKELRAARLPINMNRVL